MTRRACGGVRRQGEGPPERSTSEPAAKEMTTRGRLYRQQRLEYRQRLRHLTRSRPQDSASNAAAPQWEPRKPLGGRRKPRRGMGGTSGAGKRDLIEF